MTSTPTMQEEVSKETQEFIRAMLRDHAFSEEFLITAIQEYYANNLKTEVAV